MASLLSLFLYPSYGSISIQLVSHCLLYLDILPSVFVPLVPPPPLHRDSVLSLPRSPSPSSTPSSRSVNPQRRQRKSEERAARYRLLAGTGIFHRVSGNQAFVYGSLHAVAYPYPCACYEKGGERQGEGGRGRRSDEDVGVVEGGGAEGTGGEEEVRATEKRNVYSTAWN